jgi:hypothetical protein
LFVVVQGLDFLSLFYSLNLKGNLVMASVNKTRKTAPVYNYEGTRATVLPPVEELKKAVFSCFLWEDFYYESGESVAQRIASLIPKVKPDVCSKIAIIAREKMKLRHVPLLIAREMVRHDHHKMYVKDLLPQIIQRPDEISEFLSIYWKDGKTPIAACVKKGLAKSFEKFNEYQITKYKGDGKGISLRDVMFLVHAKPVDGRKGLTKDTRRNHKDGKDYTALILNTNEKVYKRLADKDLKNVDTWESQLSAGKDKRETFEGLMQERKLGALAFLRNLRNMQEAGVPSKTLKEYCKDLNVDRVLPFRFIAATKFAPALVTELEALMLKCLKDRKKINKKIRLLIDVSGSMDVPLSSKSDITRIDAACGLAIFFRELCEDITVWTFSNNLVQCPTYRGFALSESIVKSQLHGGTYLGGALEKLYQVSEDAITIVITDEESHDTPTYKGKGYLINVAAYKNSLKAKGQWEHIYGWSEAIVDFIAELENSESDFFEGI